MFDWYLNPESPTPGNNAHVVGYLTWDSHAKRQAFRNNKLDGESESEDSAK